MFQEKVRIPKQVEEAMLHLKQDSTLLEIIHWVTADYTKLDKNVQTLTEWNEGNNDEGETLLRLLLGQYEIERTPKEEVRVRYLFWQSRNYSEGTLENAERKGFLSGIRLVLEEFNIKIKDINE